MLSAGVHERSDSPNFKAYPQYIKSLGATDKFHQASRIACAVLIAGSIHTDESPDIYVERGPKLLASPSDLPAQNHSSQLMDSERAHLDLVALYLTPLLCTYMNRKCLPGRI